MTSFLGRNLNSKGTSGWSSAVGYQSAGGVVAGVLARGAMDCAIAQNSDDGVLVTHFRMTYKATPMFAFDHFFQDFQGCTGFGDTSVVNIGRTPDLIKDMYIELTIPGISVRKRHDSSSSSSTGSSSTGSSSTDPYSSSYGSYDSYGSSYGSGSATGFGGSGSYGGSYGSGSYGSGSYGTGSGSSYGSGSYDTGSAGSQFDRLAHDSHHPFQGFANYEDAHKQWNEGKRHFIEAYYSDASSKPMSELESKYEHLLQYMYGQAPPSKTPGSSEDPREHYFCYWTQAVGQFAVKQATIQIGGQAIDSLWGDFLFVWEELSGKAGKRLAEMIGKSLAKDPRVQKEELIRRSSQNQTLFVPLPFWFTMKYGLALPLVSIQFLQISLAVTFQDLSCLVVKKPHHVTVYNNNTNAPLRPSDMHALLMYKGIFLDGAERAIFAEGAITQLIRQVQRKDWKIQGQQQAVMPLNFNHPVQELIWTIRREHWERRNLWARLDGLLGKDPMVDVRFSINNQPRFGGRVAQYYRLVQPYEFHSHFPDTFIYCYSFALYPEELTPSGSLNFSRLDNTEIDFMFEEGLQQEALAIAVFAINHNLLNILDGLAGLSFGH
jgi:hypothetical protein